MVDERRDASRPGRRRGDARRGRHRGGGTSRRGDRRPRDAARGRRAARASTATRCRCAKRLRIGGARTLAIIATLGAIELFDNAVFNVLAPDIQDAIGVSDAVLGAIGGATGVLFVLGAMPMSSLSDRLPRKNLVAVTMSVWSVVIVLTGVVQNALQMFLARLGAGLGQSTRAPGERTAAHRHVSDPGAGEGVRGARRRAGDRHDGRAVPRRRDRRDRRRGRTAGGGRSSSSGSSRCRSRCRPSTIKEPRRGRHEMRSVLGEELAARSRRAADLVVGRVRAPAADPQLLLLPRRDGRARLRAVLGAAVPEPLLRGRARAQRVRARHRRHDHRDPGDHRDRDRRAAGRRPVPPEPARGDGVRRPARRAVRRRARRSRSGCRTCGASCRSSRVATRVRACRVRDPARGRVDDHPVPAARARHRDDRHLRVPVRLVLRLGAHRPALGRVRHAHRAHDHRAAVDAHRRRARSRSARATSAPTCRWSSRSSARSRPS